MNKTINEIFFLRGIACLSIVFIHAISSAVNNYNMRSNVELQSMGNYLFAIQLLLMYGTPMFIFISEFIISFSYKDRLPQNFFKKRIQFILVPYICMGIFYAVITCYMNSTLSMEFILINIIKMYFLGITMAILYLLFFSFTFYICIFKNIFIIRSPLRRLYCSHLF
ncbi:intercellular adhesion protein C [Bacillus cereus AH1272]|nr:intercellular adhesion protein C [Bacillus cereus AH1272]EEL90677.1 intercellular adhesion protein C [Bacillus cereus AH1273]